MRYYYYTLGEYTGGVFGRIDAGCSLPYQWVSEVVARLHAPTAFTQNEWSQNAMLRIYEPPDDVVDADVYTMDLYPVVSDRYYTVMRALFHPDEMEFLPVQLVGKDTGTHYGRFYVPHLLQAVPDCLAFPRPFEIQLISAKVSSHLRAFIAPHHTHPRLLFREDVVQAMERAGLTVGLGFEPVPWDTEDQPQTQLPLAQLFFATPDEQRQWAHALLADGAVGLLWWFRAYSARALTTLRWLEHPGHLSRLPLTLSPADAEATIQLSVYWMRPEWRERMNLQVREGDHEGGLMGFIDMRALDTGGTGWYGRWDVGYAAGQVLTAAAWALPLGWRYEPVEAYEELYAWWLGWGDWYQGVRAEGVGVRSGRAARAVDEATWVSVGAARWGLGGGVLCRQYGEKPLRLVGRGLRRLR